MLRPAIAVAAIRTGADPDEPKEARVAALASLREALGSLVSSSKVPTQAPLNIGTSWTQVMKLVYDRTQDVREEAARLLGCIGAAILKWGGNRKGTSPSTAKLGSRPEHLFTWAMQVLGPAPQQMMPGQERKLRLEQAAQKSALLALGVAMELLKDLPVAVQHYPELLQLLQVLLGQQSTPSWLLPPLLSVLWQALLQSPTDALNTNFQELVDVLLEWSLDPNLPPSCRPLIERCFMALGPAWQLRPASSASLLSKILIDMEVLVQLGMETRDALLSQCSRLVALSNCLSAMAVACGPGLPKDAAAFALLDRLSQCTKRAMDKFFGLPLGPGERLGDSMHGTTAKEGFLVTLCKVLSGLTWALAQPHTAPNVPAFGATASSDAVSQDSLKQEQEMARKRAIASLRSTSVALAAAAAGSSVPRKKLAIALLDLRFSQLQLELSGGEGNAVGGERSIVLKSAVASGLRGTWEGALPYKWRSCSWDPEIRAAAAKPVQFLLSHKCPEVRQAAVSAVTEHMSGLADSCVAGAGSGKDSNWANVASQGLMAAALLKASFTTGPISSPESSSKGCAAEVLSMCGALSTSLGSRMPPALARLLCGLVVAVLEHLISSGDGEVEEQVAEAVKLLLGLCSSPLGQDVQLQVLALQGLEAWVSWSELEGCGASSAYAGAEVDISRVISQALDSAGHSAPEVRGAAAGLLMAAGLSRKATGQESVMLDALCKLSSDSSPSVAVKASKTLPVLAAAQYSLSLTPVALQAAGSKGPRLPAKKAERQLALSSCMQMPLRPLQVVGLLGLLATGQAPDKGSIWGWLERLAAASTKRDAAGAKGGLAQLHLSSAGLSWAAVQSAAGHLVNTKLRTHYGGAAQSFAQLERMLQDWAKRLLSPEASAVQVAGPGILPTDPLEFQPVWLLLQLLEALERGMYTGYEGCLSRPPLPPPLTSFYSANRKVCEDWFARLRVTALTVSSVSGQHHCTLSHAFSRLSSLATSVKTSSAAAAASSAGSSTAKQPAEPQQSGEAAAPGSKSGLKVLRASRDPSPGRSQQPPGGDKKILMARKPSSGRLADSGIGGGESSPDASSSGPSLKQPAGSSSSEGAAGAPAAAGGAAAGAARQHNPQQLSRAVFHALHAAATSLIRLQEPEVLEGLHAWSVRTFGAALTEASRETSEAAESAGASGEAMLAWLEGAKLQASMRHEDALASYWLILNGQELQHLSTESVGWVVARMGECYAATADWPGLKEWLGRLASIRSSSGNESRAELKAALAAPTASVNRYLALARFDENDMQDASRLAELSPWKLGKEGALEGATIVSPDLAVSCVDDLELQVLVAARTRQAVAEAGPAKLLESAGEMLARAVRCQLQDSVDSAVGTLCRMMEIRVLEALPGVASNKHKQQSKGSGTANRPLNLRSDLDNPDLTASASSRDPAACLRLIRCLRGTSPLSGLQNPELRTVYQSSLVACVKTGNFSLAGKLADLLKRSAEVEEDGGSISGEVALALLRLEGPSNLGGREAGVQELWGRLIPALAGVSDPKARGSVEAKAAAGAASTMAAWLKGSAGRAGKGLAAVEAHAQEVLRGVDPPEAVRAISRPGNHDRVWAKLTESGPAGSLKVATSLCLATAASVAPEMSLSWRHLGDWCAEVSHELQEVDGISRQNGHASADDLCRAALGARLRFVSMDGGHSPERLTGTLVAIIASLANAGVAAEDSELIEQLQAVPPAVWQAVTPQLFAQLASENPNVRSCFQGILRAMASGCPASVLYPAAARAQAAETAGNEVEEDLAEVLSCLKAAHPELVPQTLAMLEEMSRCAVLWEELWHGALAEAQVDAARRSVKIQAEFKRVMENAALEEQDKPGILQDKYSAIMQPMFRLLENTWRATLGGSPSTPAELRFSARYGDRLRQELDRMRQAPEPGRSLESDLEGLRTIAAELAKDLKSPSASLASISPRLTALQGTLVPVPGQGTSWGGQRGASGRAGDDGEIVTIESLEDEVHVLKTKTRPKKLAITGSDGKRYVFLLKGREDLHMDARIMQVMGMVSAQLQSDKTACSRGLSLRGFSVTPLGNRMGLVQWVGNTTPLFTLVKRWQARTIETCAARSVPPPEGAARRPMELYHRYLSAALREAGVRSGVPRHKWPKEVQLKVFSSLKRSIPSRLLAMELWASASGPADWWARQRAYTRSAAVSSMAGWLLGIGDRHLDNILLDQVTGELVHIDFNVCLERGRRLKVPEVVPFRLTQNMVAGLGLTGISGPFRHAARTTMEIMRRSQEDLKELLKECLEDPFVDWGADRKDAATRADLETAVSLGLLSSRFNEIHNVLSGVSLSLSSNLPSMAAQLKSLLHVHASLSAAAAEASSAHTEMERLSQGLREASSGESAAMAAYNTAVAQQSSARAQLGELRSILAAGLRECQAWQARHESMVTQLRSMQVRELLLQPAALLAAEAQCDLGLVSGLQLPQGRKGTGVVVGALGAAAGRVAAPPELGSRWAAIDREALQLMLRRDNAVRALSTALKEYSAAMIWMLPANYCNSSLHGAWASAITEGLTLAEQGEQQQLEGGYPAPLAIEQVEPCFTMLRRAMQLVDARAAEATSAAASPVLNGASSASLLSAEAALESAVSSPQAILGNVAELLDEEATALLDQNGGSMKGDSRKLTGPMDTGETPGAALFGKLEVLLSSLARVCVSAGSPESSTSVLAAASHLAGTLRGLASSLSTSLTAAAASRTELCCTPEAVRGAGRAHPQQQQQQQQSLTALSAMLTKEMQRYQEAPGSEVSLLGLQGSWASATDAKQPFSRVLKCLAQGLNDLQEADTMLSDAVRQSGSAESPDSSELLALRIEWISAAAKVLEPQQGSETGLGGTDVAMDADKAAERVVKSYLRRLQLLLRQAARAVLVARGKTGPGSPQQRPPGPGREMAAGGCSLGAEWESAGAGGTGFFGPLPDDAEAEELEQQGGDDPEGLGGAGEGRERRDRAAEWEMAATGFGGAGQGFFGAMVEDGEELEVGGLEDEGLEDDGGAAWLQDEDEGEDELDEEVEQDASGNSSRGFLLDEYSADGGAAAGPEAVRAAMLELQDAAAAEAQRLQASSAQEALGCWQGWRSTLEMQAAQLEWMAERQLAALGVTGYLMPDIAACGSGGPVTKEARGRCEAQGWRLVSRRSALLASMEAAQAALACDAEAVAAYEHSASMAAFDVKQYVSASISQSFGPADASNLVRSLEERLSARAAWLKVSGDASASLGRLAEAVLLFERSRDGDAWYSTGASGASYTDSLSGCLVASYTLHNAERQATESQAMAASCHATAVRLGADLEAVRSRSGEAVGRYEALAPYIVQQVAGMQGSLQPLLEAASSALPVVSDVAAVIDEASGLLEGTEAARDFLAMAAPAASSWKAHATGLGDLLRALQGISDLFESSPELFAVTDPRSGAGGGGHSLRARAARLLEALRPVVAGLAPSMPQVESLSAAIGDSAVAEVEDLANTAASVANAIKQEHELDLEEEDADQAGGSAAGGSPLSYAASPTAGLPQAAAPQPSKLGMRPGVARLQAQRSSTSRAMTSDALKRFADKLAGREELGGSKAAAAAAGAAVAPLGVGEHVEALLARAANSERLAQMYEGWAAWI